MKINSKGKYTPFGVEIQFVKTVSDGNCGYDALRYSDYVEAKSATECRAKLFDIVNKNLDLYFKYFLILTNSAKQAPATRERYEKWIGKHCQNGIWACNIALSFAATAFNVDIISMNENGQNYYRPYEEMSWSLPTDHLPRPSGTVFIVNTGGSDGNMANHFVYGKPIGAPCHDKVLPFIASKWEKKGRGKKTSSQGGAEIDLSLSGDEEDTAPAAIKKETVR